MDNYHSKANNCEVDKASDAVQPLDNKMTPLTVESVRVVVSTNTP